MANKTNHKRNNVDTLISRLDKSDGCWKYTGRIDRDGYGRMAFEGREWFTHRLAYMWWVGPLEPGKVIMHMCDVPICCNPEHLRQGTQAENNKDCAAKGRKPKGSANGNSKLTEYQVAKIREWFTKGASGEELSKIFNVSRVQIRKILTFKNWDF